MSKSIRTAERARHHRRWGHWGSCALIALLGAGSARAADPALEPPSNTENPNASLDLARSVAVTGREAFNAGDYETALALFRRAYTLYPAPTVVLYEARTLDKMGLMLEAVEAYMRTTQIAVASDAPDQFAEAIAAARQEERALRARVPTLTLRVDGVSSNDPNLKISVNGRAIGAAQIGQAQRLNPGTYRISGSISAERSDQANLVLSEGQNAAVVLHLAAPSPTPPPPVISRHVEPHDEAAPGQNSMRMYAYIAGGVGLTGIGAGLVTGLMATSSHTKAEEECPSGLCDPNGAGPDAVDDFHSMRTVSTICYGVGVAGLATGVVLWLLSPDAPAVQAQGLAPWLDAHHVGMQGAF
jgi:hypothetical protein